jgi:hypothetical protein
LRWYSVQSAASAEGELPTDARGVGEGTGETPEPHAASKRARTSVPAFTDPS